MTPTEISEHARRAALAFSETGRPREKTWPMIQYGINLAVESKDARIAELEDERDQLRFKCTEHLLTIEDVTQSKDREIERLTMDYGCLLSRLTEELRETRRLTAQLTEANAKLAEAEYDRKSTEINKALVTAVIETQVAQEAIDLVARERDDLQSKLSSAQADCETWRKHALALEESGNRSQAEIERLKGEIIEDTSAQDAEDRREEESQRLRDLHIGRNI